MGRERGKEDKGHIAMCVGNIIAALAFPLPDPHWGADALQRHPGLVQLVTRRNERVPAVLFKADNARFTILYSHGNAEDVSISLDYLEEMAAACQANVFAYEYVGYSLSALDGAKPSEGGCFRAIETAWRHLTLTLNIHAKDIIVFGRSLGYRLRVFSYTHTHAHTPRIPRTPTEACVVCVRACLPACLRACVRVCVCKIWPNAPPSIAEKFEFANGSAQQLWRLSKAAANLP